MNNYDKMKELIKENKLKEALFLAFSNSLKLKITTKSQGDEKQEIKTVINLVKGITNRISDPNFINHPQNNSEAIDLFNFHEQQKQSAYELWRKNRETIVGILHIISGNPIEISSSKKRENKVFAITETSEKNFDGIEEELNFNDENSNSQDSFAMEENSSKEENWVNNIVDDMVRDIEDEIVSEKEDSPAENWDDFVMEEENKEAEVIISAEEEEEENWDDFTDENYSEDDIVNSNGLLSDDNLSEEEEEWQEWLEEESPEKDDDRQSLTNYEREENESSNLEVGDEWQEWLEDEDTSDNESIAEEMEAMDWSDEDWKEEKVN